jgi:hypothetical protein
MRGEKRVLHPAAAGLVLANVVVIGVVVASLLVTRRAWELRENALTALADARAQASLHAPRSRLRSTAMDRILLIGIVGAAASAYFTWLLVTRSSSLSRLRSVGRGVRGARGSAWDVRER